MQSKKPKDDKDPPKDDKDKTSTTVKPPKGEGGEGSIPGKPESSFMSNHEETVWNNAEDSTYKRIHKRFVPMVAIA